MKVFVTGGTGYIGRPLVRALVGAGHTVTVLVRTPFGAALASIDGAKPVVGTLTNTDLLSAAAARADAVIHTALATDDNRADIDKAAAAALVGGVGAGTYVHTSGAWIWGNTTGVADETAPYNPPARMSWRTRNDRAVLDSEKTGHHPVIIAPGIVYGHDGGLINTYFTEPARAAEHASVIESGDNRWALVHVDDLADLYVKALDAPAGSVYAGVGDNGATQLAVVSAMASGLGGLPVSFLDLKTATAKMGPIAESFVLDQNISNERARTNLGWDPFREPPLTALATPQRS